MQNSIQFSYIYIALTQCALYCKVRTQPSGIYLAATLGNSGTKELLFNMKIPSTTKLIRDRLWDEGKEKREKTGEHRDTRTKHKLWEKRLHFMAFTS